MVRHWVLSLAAALVSMQCIAAELHYDCRARAYDDKNVLIEESQRSLTVEGDLCLMAFDIQEKAYTLCSEESEGKMGLGIADENTSQQMKAVTSYGAKTLGAEMQSPDASYRAEALCELR